MGDRGAGKRTSSVRRKRLYVHLGDGFQALAVGVVEACGLRTVQVEDADQVSGVYERDHDLRAGVAVAGDMAGECVHIGNQLGSAGSGGGPADPLAERYSDTRRFALERADHEFVTVVEVETRPVHPR